ncbi:MAG: hypothetical protein IT463_02825 [Planctomycetes bacterium]|nr:hypothetical protein [Planctomycetota bacterium]
MARTTWLCLALLALLCGCAEVDPYRRAPEAPAPGLTAEAATAAFNDRWPAQFKCVQTVTLDFGPVTRTLVGYLVVQRPGRFRLQGMTEQGLKVFELVGDGDATRTIFAADDMQDAVLQNIARDIRRVFLAAATPAATAEFEAGECGARLQLRTTGSTQRITMVGQPPAVDEYELFLGGRRAYRVNQYEWKRNRPEVIVLRETGRESKGPPYKLTIRITEFTERPTPWPVKVFAHREKP